MLSRLSPRHAWETGQFRRGENRQFGPLRINGLHADRVFAHALRTRTRSVPLTRFTFAPVSLRCTTVTVSAALT